MANGTRTLTLVIVLIVGVAVGWFLGRGAPTLATTCPTPGDHIIEVGPKAADVSDPKAAISMMKGHKVFWTSKDETRALRITFKASDFPAGGEPPFEGGQPGRDQVITCNPGGVCKSGRINPNLKPPECPRSLYYKYWQTLIDKDGKEETADAGIIIEK